MQRLINISKQLIMHHIREKQTSLHHTVLWWETTWSDPNPKTRFICGPQYYVLLIIQTNRDDSWGETFSTIPINYIKTKISISIYNIIQFLCVCVYVGGGVCVWCVWWFMWCLCVFLCGVCVVCVCVFMCSMCVCVF